MDDKTGQFPYKRMKLNPYLTQYTQIYSKQIKDFNIRLETINLLEENTGEKLLDNGLANDFMDMTPESTSNKNKNKQVGPHPTKRLLHSKRKDRQQEKAIYGMGENIHKSHI